MVVFLDLSSESFHKVPPPTPDLAKSCQTKSRALDRSSCWTRNIDRDDIQRNEEDFGDCMSWCDEAEIYYN